MSSAAQRPLVVCADDFAVHESASRAIAQLAALGRISATSAMVLSPRWRADAALLEDLRGSIDVGLHLDWTSAYARHAGHGLSLGAAMLKAALGGFERRLTLLIIERQLDAFESRWQAPPDFVDGHQHVQQFAGIREALVEILHQRYGAAAPYLRVSRAPAAEASLKSRVIASMGANALEMIAAQAGLTCSAALLGTYNLDADEAAYARHMQRWLAQAPPRSILMCHPALEAWARDAHGESRAHEYAYLSGAQFAQALATTGLVIARGASCLGPKIDR